jgi:hypothetical protein
MLSLLRMHPRQNGPHPSLALRSRRKADTGKCWRQPRQVRLVLVIVFLVIIVSVKLNQRV